MARLINLEAARTYASVANVQAAVAKANIPDSVLYFIQRTAEGRFFPVFIGQAALSELVHLRGFSVVV